MKSGMLFILLYFTSISIIAFSHWCPAFASYLQVVDEVHNVLDSHIGETPLAGFEEQRNRAEARTSSQEHLDTELA